MGHTKLCSSTSSTARSGVTDWRSSLTVNTLHTAVFLSACCEPEQHRPVMQHGRGDC